MKLLTAIAAFLCFNLLETHVLKAALLGYSTLLGRQAVKKLAGGPGLSSKRTDHFANIIGGVVKSFNRGLERAPLPSDVMRLGEVADEQLIQVGVPQLRSARSDLKSLVNLYSLMYNNGVFRGVANPEGPLFKVKRYGPDLKRIRLSSGELPQELDAGYELMRSLQNAEAAGVAYQKAHGLPPSGTVLKFLDALERYKSAAPQRSDPYIYSASHRSRTPASAVSTRGTGDHMVLGNVRRGTPVTNLFPEHYNLGTFPTTTTHNF